MLSISCSTIERLLAPRANVKAMHVLDPAEEGTQPCFAHSKSSPRSRKKFFVSAWM
jgi:hypothetical protein